MESKILEALVQAGALGMICAMLIVSIGKKMDRLHDVLAQVVKEAVCKYREPK